MKRKIIQITSTSVIEEDGGHNVVIHALCDDGTLWIKGRYLNVWHKQNIDRIINDSTDE